MKVQYGSWDQLVVSRLDDAATAQERARQKTYNLRKLVAGDTSMFGGMPATQEVDPKSANLSDLYDFIVESVEEGRSNGLLEGVKTLLMQTSFKFPQVEFEDLEPVQAAINAGACKELLGPPPQGCSALDEMRQVLLDYLIGGIGWSEIAFDPYTESPIVRACDSLDVTWDTSGKLPTRAKWVSTKIRKPLGYWLEHFGTKKLSTIAGTERIVGKDFDKPIELEFYYDTDGGKGRGTHYVFRRSNRSTIDPTVIHQEENPFYYEMQSGLKKPFLPLTPMYFIRLPSTRNAVSLVEFMLPDQLGIWRDEDRIFEVIERMKAHTLSPKAALDDLNKAIWEKGDCNALIEYDPLKGKPETTQPGEVPRTVLDDRSYHQQRRQALLGADPYASGAPVEGTRFASEVQAINQASGLTAGTISADNTNLWVNTLKKFLGVLSVYGDMPLSIRYDGVTIEYGKMKPVKDRIVPDADISIREDSTVYRSRQQKMQEALGNVELSMKVPQFPNLLPWSIEQYLQAAGVQNITDLLEQPAQTGMPQDPQAEAASQMSGIQ